MDSHAESARSTASVCSRRGQRIHDHEYRWLVQHTNPDRYLLWLLLHRKGYYVNTMRLVRCKYSPELVSLILYLNQHHRLTMYLSRWNTLVLMRLLQVGNQTAFEVMLQVYRHEFHTELWTRLYRNVHISPGQLFKRGPYTEEMVNWLGKKAKVSATEIREMQRRRAHCMIGRSTIECDQ